MPREARLGRSVQRRRVPINKERFASIIRWLRIFEQTTPALRATRPNFGGDYAKLGLFVIAQFQTFNRCGSQPSGPHYLDSSGL